MNERINIRIKDEVKAKLENCAKLEKLPFSAYTRKVLTDHVDNYEPSTENNIVIPDDEILIYLDPDYHKSHEFSVLVTWILSKFIDPTYHWNFYEFLMVKDFIKKAITKTPFSQELKDELLKIDNELSDIIKDPKGFRINFSFTNYFSSKSFDHKKLVTEVLNQIKYESNEKYEL